MVKKAKIKKDPHPPYKPRMIWGIHGDGVSVVRIPERFDPALKQKALKEARELARSNSNTNPRYW